LIFDLDSEIYKGADVNFNSLNHLDTLGLVKVEHMAGFLRRSLPMHVTLYYYGELVELTLPNEQENRIKVGRVLLTVAGQELATICGSLPVNGFLEFVCELWEKQGLPPRKSPAFGQNPGT
jgi:hypothetical protein